MAMRAIEDGIALRERIQFYPVNVCAVVTPLVDVLFALASHSSPLCKQARKLVGTVTRQIRKPFEHHVSFAPRLSIYHGRFLWTNGRPRKVGWCCGLSWLCISGIWSPVSVCMCACVVAETPLFSCSCGVYAHVSFSHIYLVSFFLSLPFFFLVGYQALAERAATGP
jgi:hypothetical protein